MGGRGISPMLARPLEVKDDGRTSLWPLNDSPTKINVGNDNVIMIIKKSKLTCSLGVLEVSFLEAFVLCAAAPAVRRMSSG